MVNENQYYILDQLKVLFHNRLINPAILITKFRSIGILKNDDVTLIERKFLNTDRLIEFCDTLKAQPESCLLEIQKFAVSNNWSDISDYVETELRNSGCLNLIYQATANGQYNEGLSGSVTTTTTLVTTVAKELNFSEIREILDKIFTECDYLNPEHYVASLLQNRVITELYKTDIEKLTYKPDKQLKLAESIAAGRVAAVRKFRDIVAKNNDVTLMELLDKSFGF